MNEKEMALLVHYTMRNHIGAMALNSEGEEDGYMRLYKTMKEERRHATTIFRKLRSVEKDLDKLLGKEGNFKHVEYRPYEDAEKRINEQLNKQGFVSILDVYDELGIDTAYERYLIEHGRGYDVGWLKGVK